MATDVDGWISLMPIALVLGVLILGGTALLEQTERGRRFADRVIERIERSR
jgi:hypothetical protein